MKENFIFEKTHELEAEIIALTENIFMGIEPCKNNKEEILHYLIHAQHCLQKVYELNEKNIVKDEYMKNLKNFVDVGRRII